MQSFFHCAWNGNSSEIGAEDSVDRHAPLWNGWASTCAYACGDSPRECGQTISMDRSKSAEVLR